MRTLHAQLNNDTLAHKDVRIGKLFSYFIICNFLSYLDFLLKIHWFFLQHSFTLIVQNAVRYEDFSSPAGMCRALLGFVLLGDTAESAKSAVASDMKIFGSNNRLADDEKRSASIDKVFSCFHILLHCSILFFEDLLTLFALFSCVVPILDPRLSVEQQEVW